MIADSVARAVERERCARLAEQVARYHANPDGSRKRGAPGALQKCAEQIARMIRDDTIQPEKRP